MNAPGTCTRSVRGGEAYESLARGRDGNSEIYVMNIDGSEQRNLTRSAGGRRLGRLSPVRTKDGDPQRFT